MAAMLLAQGKSTLKKVPNLSDIDVLMQILGTLEPRSNAAQTAIFTSTRRWLTTLSASTIWCGKCVRVSAFWVRFWHAAGRVEVSLPGGCDIGDRPVDIHLRGLAELRVKIYLKNGYIVAEAPAGGLVGKDIFLGGPFGSTVLGTDNVMMAATLAKGRTIVAMAACEPEVADLARCLNAMGAKISGIGSPRLTIDGVKQLHPVGSTVIPDRIEAGR